MAEPIIIEVGRSERGLVAYLGDLPSPFHCSLAAELAGRSKHSAIEAHVSVALIALHILDGRATG